MIVSCLKGGNISLLERKGKEICDGEMDHPDPNTVEADLTTE
jgi:hypothetical protein